MRKEYFCYGLCGAIAFRGIILPDWPSTIALLFAVALCGLWMWLDHKTAQAAPDSDIQQVKTDIKDVSARLSKLSLKIGVKQ